MKEHYEGLYAEVIRFEALDVITTSPTGSGDTETQPVPAGKQGSSFF